MEYQTGSDDGRQLAMPARKQVGVALVAVMVGLLLQSPLWANENKNFSVGLSGLIGGPFDADSSPDPGLDNTGFSGFFAWHTQPQTKVVVRVAKADFGEQQFGSLFDPELSYINVGGEYTFREPYYTSGFYLGLGLYQLEGLVAGSTNSLPGTPLSSLSQDDSSVGVALGVTADFSVVESVSLFADLSFHYADLGEASFFGFLHFGVAFHF